MKCEWSKVKYEINLKRHGLRFELAELAFDDPYAITKEDYIDERGDQRYQTIAGYEGVLFLIAHVFIVRNRVELPRVISLRKAVKHEQEEYYRRR